MASPIWKQSSQPTHNQSFSTFWTH